MITEALRVHPQRNFASRGLTIMDELKKLIRAVPDYPKPGILFYDLTTLLKDQRGFHSLVDQLCEPYTNQHIDVVVGVEARGFIFAPALAYRLGAGFVPVRKPKKLPGKTAQVSYQLEYGTDTLEIHEDAIRPGQTVIVSDDLLATGGTAAATVELVKKLGGKVNGAVFAVELTFLKGRAKLPGLDVFSLIQYDAYTNRSTDHHQPFLPARCRTTSNKATPAATETFNERIGPTAGM